MITTLKNFFVNFWKLLVASGSKFADDDAIKLGASLSYYTVFSIAPMIIVLIAICGFFFGREAIEGEVYEQINGLVGDAAAKQIQEMIKFAGTDQKSFLAKVIGIVTLLIGATGIFAEIQSSINTIWGIRAKPKKGWLKYLQIRATSFALIISMGFVLLVSLALNTILDLLFDKILTVLPTFTTYIVYLLNIVFILAVVSLLFAVIFKVLPDGKLKWKDAFIGSSFTALLFLLGKFAIGFYLSSTNVATSYGSASSLILLLLWVYYSSFILYFGAEFTYMYSSMFGTAIKPNEYAVIVEKTEVHIDADNNRKEVDMQPDKVTPN